MNKPEQHYIVHMNFVFGNLTEKQIEAIADRLGEILDEEFTEDWMMTNKADALEETNEEG